MGSFLEVNLHGKEPWGNFSATSCTVQLEGLGCLTGDGPCFLAGCWNPVGGGQEGGLVLHLLWRSKVGAGKVIQSIYGISWGGGKSQVLCLGHGFMTPADEKSLPGWKSWLFLEVSKVLPG